MENKPFENIDKENKKEDNKPELGSFEFNPRKGIVMRKDVSLHDIIENEKEYKESKLREDAIRDLEKRWDNIDIKLSNNFKRAVLDPEKFYKFVNESIEKHKSEEIKDFLEDMLEEFKDSKESLNYTKEAMVEERLNFKDTDDIDLNEDLKKRLEKRIKQIDGFINTTDELIEYVKDKITEVIL